MLPRVMDRVLSTPEVNARRALVCRGLRGRVLEIGFGSGLNLRHYPAEVTEILVVEPSESALRLAEPRTAAISAALERVGSDGARLDLPDGSVDCVLSTYTLCTIPSVDAALKRFIGCSSRMVSCTSSSTGGRQPNPSVVGSAASTRCTAVSPEAAIWTDPSTT